MDFIQAFSIGSGLAGAAAFRAFFPLVLIAFSKAPGFPPHLDWFSSTPIFILLLVLMVMEFLLGEVPGVGFFHSSIYTIVKVVIGGILFSVASGFHPVLGYFLGGLITGLLIFSRLVLEPWLAAQLPYFRHFEYESVENLFSIVLSILALAVPVISLLMVTGLAFLIVWTVRQVEY